MSAKPRPNPEAIRSSTVALKAALDVLEHSLCPMTEKETTPNRASATIAVSGSTPQAIAQTSFVRRNWRFRY